MENFYRWREQRNISPLNSKLSEHPVAYFCMEYALPDNLPIYAGGLGVLAGDYVMEAYQQDFPMFAIGMFYAKKCYAGDFGGYCEANDPIKLGLQPVMDKLGYRIKIKIPIGTKNIYLQAWFYHNGTIPLYLLDTNVEENDIEDREILDLLYVGSSEQRIKQELVLGLGGMRLIAKLGLKPSIYHMNEGHSAFLVYELVREIMDSEGKSFTSAYKIARNKIAFTNHTLVLGAHDVFDIKMITDLLKLYIKETGFSAEKLLENGLDKKNKNVFSTTFLALNSAAKINAVSKLHSVEAKKNWPEYDTLTVTNGVNLQRWDKMGDGEDIVAKHAQNKKLLLEMIRKNTGVRWKERELIVGWARRIVSYKRPTSLFDDINALKKLVNNRKEPLRLLFSGQPHYNDSEGQYLLNFLRKMAQEELRGGMVFLERYSTDVSSKMIAGCDVWLNTPIVGLEASGTSGMKAALNGVLQCSTNDGWLPEVDLNKIGFVLDDKYISLSLINTFKNRLVPLYYQHQKKSKIDSIWRQKMEWSRESILHHFGSDRMLKDYVNKIYNSLLSLQ